MADFTRLNGYNVKDTVAREGVNNLDLSKASHADVEKAIEGVNETITDLAKDVDDLETLFNASGISQDAQNITFNNTLTGLTSTHVQGAIEEVKEIADSGKAIAESTQEFVNEVEGEMCKYNVETDALDIYSGGEVVGSFPCRFQITQTFIYNKGDEFTDTTGGWSGSGYKYGTITTTAFGKDADSINVVYASEDQIACIGTVNMIDLTNYSKLYVKSNFSAVAKNGVPCYISPNKNPFNSGAVVQQNMGTTGETINEIDITNVSGSYYIIFCCSYNPNWGATGEITEIWFE